MAIGPQERDALRKRVGEQYKQKDIPVLMVGLDLALRGFELSRRRLDNNALEWEQYVPLRGHYNATAAGILDAFEEQGLTPQAAMIWKKTHARFWTELEEPAYMTAYCTQLFQRMLPHIVAAHSSLRALANMLVSLKAKADDPKSVAVIRSSIESNTAGLNRAGFGIEVRALRSIHGFDSTTDYHWMEKYLPKLNGPVQAPAAQAVASQVSSSIVRPRGLQKCAPSGGGPDDATYASGRCATVQARDRGCAAFASHACCTSPWFAKVITGQRPLRHLGRQFWYVGALFYGKIRPLDTSTHETQYTIRSR